LKLHLTSGSDFYHYLILEVIIFFFGARAGCPLQLLGAATSSSSRALPGKLSIIISSSRLLGRACGVFATIPGA
jgi:hypothetical protein